MASLDSVLRKFRITWNRAEQRFNISADIMEVFEEKFGQWLNVSEEVKRAEAWFAANIKRPGTGNQLLFLGRWMWRQVDACRPRLISITVDRLPTGATVRPSLTLVK